MNNAALIGIAIGAIIVLSMTGLLVYVGVCKQFRYVWKRALVLDFVGVVVVMVSIAYLVGQLGPCDNALTC